MTTKTDWAKLREDHEIAHLHADVCLGSPQSYTLDEKRQICEHIEASAAEIDAALKADFESMPPKLQSAMLDLLQQADPGNFQWWLDTLVGKTLDAPPERV